MPGLYTNQLYILTILNVLNVWGFQCLSIRIILVAQKQSAMLFYSIRGLGPKTSHNGLFFSFYIMNK